MGKMNNGDLSEVGEIEYHLRSSLRPISPREDYINHLHHRLTDPTRPQVTNDRNKPFRYLIVGVVGMVSLLLIIVTSLRMLLSILGILGLVRKVKRQKTQEKLVLNNPVQT
jgi:hypothetical protein